MKYVQAVLCLVIAGLVGAIYASDYTSDNLTMYEDCAVLDLVDSKTEDQNQTIGMMCVVDESSGRALYVVLVKKDDLVGLQYALRVTTRPFSTGESANAHKLDRLDENGPALKKELIEGVLSLDLGNCFTTRAGKPQDKDSGICFKALADESVESDTVLDGVFEFFTEPNVKGSWAIAPTGSQKAIADFKIRITEFQE